MHAKPAAFFAFLAASSLAHAANYMDQANEKYNEGKTIQAIELYKKAALAGENPALCYFNMANAYFQIDSLPHSIVYYKACIGYAPEFFRAHLNLAIAYHSLDDIGACVASARRALDLEPNDEKALLILAASYRRAGAYPEAIATFEQIALLYPANDESYVALAEMNRELGDHEGAVEWLLRYPEGGRNEAYVNILLADIYENKGDLQRAVYHLNLAYEKDDTNKWVLYRKVLLLEKSGNELVALETARRGLENRPSFAELALLAGNISFNLEKHNDAERYYTVARNNGSAGAVIGLENVRVVRLQQAEND
ncbi:MAG: tetratricopeptide repeat protein [Chitinivibrionales bacterium]|nr:tetratricopeptide repeat protein [Chitinivibrionales bacterium]MBD3394124.1 tetratricopeptide repeat protein [Chitinivibrionales bacterium]